MSVGSKMLDSAVKLVQRVSYRLKGSRAYLEHFASTPERWAADPRSSDPSWNVREDDGVLSIARIVE